MASPKLLKRIQQLLAQIITYEMSDPRIKFASVTKVELSKDNRYCSVYVSILGDKPQQRTVMRGIEHAKGHIQTKLGDRLALRHTPILKFVEDHSIEKSIEMSRMLREVTKDSPVPPMESVEDQEDKEEDGMENDYDEDDDIENEYDDDEDGMDDDDDDNEDDEDGMDDDDDDDGIDKAKS